MIEVKDLCKNFGATKAVNHVSFNVDRGEVVGFLGPNGAGKTTTMRLLTCFLSPDSGTATLGGFDINKDPIRVRKLLGYLPEGAPLYEDMGVIDHLKFIADIHGMSRRDKSSRIHEMISVCGLRGVIHKNVGELSKGFRQRLGLASAILHDPEILILDEPTSGLEPKQNLEIRELIKEIGKEKCVVFSTHILPEVELTCDRAIIINDGKVIAEGTVEELGRMVRGNDIYYVTFLGDVNSIREKLDKFEKIDGYEEKEDKNTRHFILNSNTQENMGEDIFDLAIEGGFKIIELRREKARLEDTFLSLTKAIAERGNGKSRGDA